MARAKIQINGPAATAATVAIGSTVQFSNDDNGGELTYAWSIVDQPEGAADTLSSGAIENPTLVPMKEGTYLIRLVVNASLGSEAIQTAAVSVLDARTGERIPAATETTETGASKGWALGANRILARALRSSVDGNLVVAITPGGISAGQIVKLSGIGTVNTGFPSQFTATQIVAVNGTVLVSGQVGIVIDGVTAGVLTVGKLVQIRLFGLVPTSGSGSPVVGDRIYLGDAGLPALSPGTVARAIGYVVASSAGSYQWVIDGADAGGVPDGDKGDVTVSGGGGTWAVDALPESRITNLVSDLASKANTSSLATIATSGSASDLAGGTVPAARMPALTGDVTSSSGSVATTIANAAVTNVKMANMAAATLKGSVGGGSPADLTSTQAKGVLAIAASDVSGLATVATSGSASDLGSGTLPAGRLPALTGDVTSSAGSAATTIAANVVTNAKAAQMAAHTHKGNNTGSTANALDLTSTQLTADLNAFTTALQGLVSASGAIGNVLRGDNTWSTITQLTAALDLFTTGLRGVVPPGVSADNVLRGDATWGIVPIAALQFGSGMFGDGSDAALSGSRTMTRNLYCTTYTLANGDAVDAGNFKLYCSVGLIGPASGSATIRSNGGNAAAAVKGTGAVLGFFGAGSDGANASGTGSGQAGSVGGSVPTDFRSGVGGAGGTGTNPGGAGGALTPLAATAGGYNDLHTALRGRLEGSTTVIGGGTGGGSGCGGGPGTGTGGAGGGGAGSVAVIARTTTNAANITIQANGGNGGNATAGTGAPCGGGGGGGGYATQVIGYGTACAIQANGGSPGTGTGGGASGGGGNAGKTSSYVLLA